MKICIDAGHNYSGYDTGRVANGLREQDISFFIAHKLANRLREYGIEIIETRPTKETNLGYDVNSSLQARCDIANKANADYFISIHCNGHSDSSASGTETLVYALGGKAEQLAKAIQTNLVNVLKTRDRGVKVQNLKVLRSTNMPAVLVETAFISNQNDATILAHRQDDIVEAITKGICEFLRIPYIQKEAFWMDWKTILRKVATNPDDWERGINAAVNAAKADGDLGALEIFQHLPLLIEKIYNYKK